MRVFRLIDEDFADTAFTGEGARLFGGRWNSPGTPVVYTASSLSLAQLELLVHLDAEDVLFRHWLYFPVNIDPAHVLSITEYAAIPEDYMVWPIPESTRRMGDRWITQQASVALTIPSALTPGELNLLLNPRHPAYSAAVSVTGPERLSFDVRLARA